MILANGHAGNNVNVCAIETTEGRRNYMQRLQDLVARTRNIGNGTYALNIVPPMVMMLTGVVKQYCGNQNTIYFPAFKTP